jgi:hypothetical protein
MRVIIPEPASERKYNARGKEEAPRLRRGLVVARAKGLPGE